MAKLPEKEPHYRFAAVSDDDKDAGIIQCADEPRLAILAVCVAGQQAAGFGACLDAREAKCPDCGAPGFNGGWGTFRFACGAEILNDEERTPAEPCGALTAGETP